MGSSDGPPLSHYPFLPRHSLQWTTGHGHQPSATQIRKLRARARNARSASSVAAGGSPCGCVVPSASEKECSKSLAAVASTGRTRLLRSANTDGLDASLSEPGWRRWLPRRSSCVLSSSRSHLYDGLHMHGLPVHATVPLSLDGNPCRDSDGSNVLMARIKQSNSAHLRPDHVYPGRKSPCYK